MRSITAKKVLAERAASEGPQSGQERVSARSGGRVRIGRAVEASSSLPAWAGERGKNGARV